MTNSEQTETCIFLCTMAFHERRARFSVFFLSSFRALERVHVLLSSGAMPAVQTIRLSDDCLPRLHQWTSSTISRSQSTMCRVYPLLRRSHKLSSSSKAIVLTIERLLVWLKHQSAARSILGLTSKRLLDMLRKVSLHDLQ